MKTFTDTYTSVVAELFTDVKRTAPLSLRQGHCDIDVVLSGDKDVAHNSVYLEFRRADTNCTVCLRFDNARGRFSYERQSDADGNDWEELKLSVDINYPCHGSASTQTVLARLAFLNEVTLWATQLEATYNRCYWRISQTSAEKAEVARRAAGRKHEEHIALAISDNVKGLRVGGQSRKLGMYKAYNIGAGTYERSYKGKLYELTVDAEGNGHVVRMS